jgi:hypothetical protein
MRKGLRFKLISVASFLLFAVTAQGQQPPPPRPIPPRGEAEEPDFAFIAGSAYLQGKNSIQFIHQTAYGTRRFAEASGARRNEDAFLFFQRVEYGITGRWELDFVLPAAGSRTQLNGRTVTSDYALADGLVGVRYQFLAESKAPFALAMGPQIIFPSGSVQRGTGNGSVGFAWDAAASKDWRGPLFLYATFNHHALPSAADTTPGSGRRFLLQGAAWATALGIQAVERPVRGTKHDLHFLLEGGGAWEQEVEPGLNSGRRRGKQSWTVSPGIRYGFLTSRRTLVEIGAAVPVGLGPNGPKRTIVVQFQYEFYFQPPAAARK